MAIFVLTFHVRKTRMCHRGAWKAGWQFPNVTRPELKVRGRPLFVLTLHVRKTGKCHRGAWKSGWQFPDVTRQEQNWRERPIFILTSHVRKSGKGKSGEKCHTDHTEVPQWSRNSVVQNRLVNDVPCRAFQRGWFHQTRRNRRVW